MTIQLCDKLLHGKDRYRDTASIALKTIISELTSPLLAKSILVLLSPNLINGITASGMSSEIRCVNVLIFYVMSFINLEVLWKMNMSCF